MLTKTCCVLLCVCVCGSQRHMEEVKTLKTAKVELMRQQKQKAKEHEERMRMLRTEKSQLSRQRTQLQKGMGQLQNTNRAQKVRRPSVPRFFPPPRWMLMRRSADRLIDVLCASGVVYGQGLIERKDKAIQKLQQKEKELQARIIALITERKARGQYHQTTTHHLPAPSRREFSHSSPTPTHSCS